jgi:hypothetical protein
MEFRVRLVHADAQHRVVRVEALDGERFLGSALGEAENAEVAEDRAVDRLRRRLRPGNGATVSQAAAPSPLPNAPPGEGQASKPARSLAPIQPALVPDPGVEGAGPAPPGLEDGAVRAVSAPQGIEEPSEPPVDPEDWSADLSRLDGLLRQLGWSREEERVFMQRLFGQPSRSRLTRYADLQLLGRALESLPVGSRPESAPLPMVRSDLLSQCDSLLNRLGWATDQARQWLEDHFSVTSRQRLSDAQLLAFNLMLESELLNVPAAVQTRTVA